MNSISAVVRPAFLLFFLGIALLCAAAVTAHLLGRAAEVDFKAASGARDLSRSADGLRSALQAAESSQRGYLATGNEIYLAPYGAARKDADKKLASLRAVADASEWSDAALARLGELVGLKLAEMDETIQLARDRQSDEVAKRLRSNLGKSLMDEANVFLSSFVRRGDAALSVASEAQRHNLVLLRAVNIGVALLIVLIVGAASAIIWNFARKLVKAHSALIEMNDVLERRVTERTDDLSKARDRAELLLSEVNHRVANSLSIVASMVKMQVREMSPGPTRDILSETEARIHAVALVHKRLYTSGDVSAVDLGAFLASLVEQLRETMRSSGHSAEIRHELESISVPTDRSVSIGVVTAELVTNAFKYAYPEGSGEIRVKLHHRDQGMAELLVEDDGVGRLPATDAPASPKGTGLGTKLVNAMASSLGGRVDYRDLAPGTSASLVIPI